MIALKLVLTLLPSIACRAGAAIGASVKTKDSMVAMSGAIMPAPLAMPAMVTSIPSIATVAAASLGNVSVVMIARAASAMPPGAASLRSRSKTPSNLDASRGSPITPVDAMKISLGLAFSAAAASLAVKAVAAAPVFPVKALALPEFTTSARALPLASLARHHSTGADGHFEVVNTPATCVPSSKSASSTSVRSL